MIGNPKTLSIGKMILVVSGIAMAVVFSELGLRAMKLLRVAVLSADEKPMHAINDAYEKKDEYQGKIDRFALMRFSCFLGYYPLENHRGKGYVSNRYGFRYGEDFPIRKPDGELRIFVTGGSTAWGWGVNQEDLFTTAAEKALQMNFPDIKIRVVCAGVLAYLSTHERILVLNKIRDFEPDIVIMFSGYNDIWAGYAGKQSVDDTWDYLEAAPVLAKYNRYYSPGNPDMSNDIYPPRYSDYIFKTHYIIDRFLYGLKGRKGLEESIAGIRIDRNTVLDNLENAVRTVADASKRDGFTCVFYLQPSLFNTKKKLSPSEASFQDSAQVWYVGFPEYCSSLYDLYRMRLPLSAMEEGFIFADGDEAFSHETGTVFIDQVHLGDRGNRLIAQHLAEIVTGLLKADTTAHR